VSWISVLVVAIGVALVAVALLPLIVLLDLAGGGDGLGLCTGGLGGCRTSYFDGPELLGVLGLVIFVLVVAMRAARQAQAAAERRQEDTAFGPSVGGRDRLGGW
jgi:hypothetical protein